MSINRGFINSTVICNEKKEVDLDALNLLATGNIAGLCCCSYKNENRHHHFVYDVNGLIPITQFQNELSFETVIDILFSALETIQTLSENKLVLDNVKNAKDYIFKSERKYVFIYIPIVRKSHIGVGDFIAKLVSAVHYKDVRLTRFVKELRKKKDDKEAVAYVTAFVYSYHSHDENSYEETALLSGEASFYFDNEGETSVLGSKGETSLLRTNTNIQNDNGLYFSNTGETTVLNRNECNEDGDEENENCIYSELTEYYDDESGEYETTVLTSQPILKNIPLNERIEIKNSLYFIRSLNGEKITVDVTPFTIGKDSANMDFVLNNNSVSRHHATVIYENGDYYIMDNGSTNGTTVEGVKLQVGEKAEIENGCIISFGNESFQAHIERG